MKKVIMGFLLFICMTNVHAISYTDYSSFGPYMDKKIDSDELTDVRVERRYKYYKLNKELGPYVKEESDQFPYLDKEDISYTEYSPLSTSLPNDLDGKEIEEYDGYEYYKYGPIDTVIITAYKQDISFKTFELVEQNIVVPYETDGDITNIKKGQSIKLKLDKTEMSHFYIRTFTGGVSGNYYDFNVKFIGDGITYVDLNTQEVQNGINMYNITIAPKANYSLYYSLDKINDTDILKYKDQVKLYRYREKLCRSYNLVKEYYSNYLTEPYLDYIYKDELLYKDFYAKRTRSIIQNNEPINNEPIIEKKEVIINPKEEYKVKNITQLYTEKQIEPKPIKKEMPEKNKKIITNKKVHRKKTNYVMTLPLMVLLFLLLSKCYQKQK